MTLAALRGATPAAAALAVAAAISCAPGRAARPDGATPPESAEGADTTRGALIPPGLGTLRQDDIAIKVQLQSVLVKAIPLDEGVIRVLSPDSYRALRDLLRSRESEVAAAARRNGLRAPRVWYVSFFGLQPEARFSPMELTITNVGRDFRPLEVIPLSPGFGEQRLRQREVQSALYLFDEALDVEQPLVVTLEDARNDSWSSTLRTIERERALVRSRASRTPSP